MKTTFKFRIGQAEITLTETIETLDVLCEAIEKILRICQHRPQLEHGYLPKMLVSCDYVNIEISEAAVSPENILYYANIIALGLGFITTSEDLNEWLELLPYEEKDEDLAPERSELEDTCADWYCECGAIRDPDEECFKCGRYEDDKG